MATISYQQLLDAEAQAEARRRRPLRLLLIFLTAFFALQYAWEMGRGSPIERAVIDHATVAPAAWLIDTLWPEQTATAQGNRIVSPQGRLNILNGCEGLETLFLLSAAFLAYPFAWRSRLVGLALGLVLVYLLNQARILLLWQAFLHDRALFGILHGTVLPLAMIAACLAYFLLFLARHEPRPA